MGLKVQDWYPKIPDKSFSSQINEVFASLKGIPRIQVWGTCSRKDSILKSAYNS